MRLEAKEDQSPVEEKYNTQHEEQHNEMTFIGQA